MTLHRETGDPGSEANTLDVLGYVHRHLGHYSQAIHHYQRAIDVWCDLGTLYGQAYVLDHLGDAYRAAGNVHTARTTRKQALDILTDVDHPEAEGVRTKLAALDNQSSLGKALES